MSTVTPQQQWQITLSPQQEAALEWVRTGKGSLILKAYAGTGKTSTLMEMAKIIKGQGFCGAYNKAIAEEFKERLMRQKSCHVKGATLHSAGFAAWAKVIAGNVDVASRKVEALAKVKALNNKKLPNVIKDAVGYAKQACFGVEAEGVPEIEDEDAWVELIEHHDLEEEIPWGVTQEKFVRLCQEVYRESLDACREVIDFDDMLLAPLYFKTPLKRYDWVLIDEVQDLNMARKLLAFGMMRGDSRMVAVGDPWQAIYGFSGALNNSMDLVADEMRKRGEFKELPLSVTYRCPKSVVGVAREWVSDFSAHEANPQGLVTVMNHQDFFRQRFVWNDVILCRNTRPLVGIAGRLREAGVACVVEGGSGKGLRNLAVKWGEDLGLDEFLECLEEYEVKESARWEKKNKLDKLEWVQDRCRTLVDMCAVLGYQRVPVFEDAPVAVEKPKAGFERTTRHLVQRIDLLFGENNQNVLRLCTIHRSKGREWNRVYLIGRNRYMPSPYAKKEWEITQEEHLAYVAVTRAKVELVEVEVPFKDKRKEQEWWES